MNTIRRGHYFEFARGEWVKDGDKPAQRFPASGLTYVGSLTRAQRDELDALIDGYFKRIDANGLPQLVAGAEQQRKGGE